MRSRLPLLLLSSLFACGGGVDWATASGRGVVHTFTVVRQTGEAPFRDQLPYVVAVIELDEGVRMMGNVTGCPVEGVRIGLPVEAYAVECGDGLAVPFWRPAVAARPPDRPAPRGATGSRS